jgi:hypothetical protein
MNNLSLATCKTNCTNKLPLQLDFRRWERGLSKQSQTLTERRRFTTSFTSTLDVTMTRTSVAHFNSRRELKSHLIKRRSSVIHIQYNWNLSGTSSLLGKRAEFYRIVYAYLQHFLYSSSLISDHADDQKRSNS